MKTMKSKAMAIIIAALITFSMTASTILTSEVNAQTYVGNVVTYPHIAINPNPVGVNQKALIDLWVIPLAPDLNDYLSSYTLTIKAPDGTTTTKGPFTAGVDGMAMISYTPTEVGNYSLQLSFPGNYFADVNETYLPSQSPITVMTVQQQPVPGYSYPPLPTSYWTNPINGLNPNWETIGGNWLMRDNTFAPPFLTGDTVGASNDYSEAPLAAHIMWTSPLEMGGIVGGNWSGSASNTDYYNGLSYEPELTPPIIMDGYLYYNLYTLDNFGYRYPGFACADLRTGKQLWEVNNDTITNGQLYYYDMPNQMGVWPFLWSTSGSTWNVYDASTGHLLMSYENAYTGGNVVYGSDGTMYYYVLNGVDGWLAMWNSTLAFQNSGLISTFAPGTGVNFFDPLPGDYNWNSGLQWNVSIPLHVVVAPSTWTSTVSPNGPAIIGYSGNVLFAIVSDGGVNVYGQVGYDMTNGKQLWYNNATGVVNMQCYYYAVGDGMYAGFSMRTMTWTAWNINTGAQLWVSKPLSYPWGAYMSYSPIIDNGVLYCGSFDGHEYAINDTTGDLIWAFYAGNVTYYPSSYGTYPFWYGPITAGAHTPTGGVVFAGTGEETPDVPLAPGYRLFAINETTGQQIWNILGMMDIRAIADGYLVAFNGYDSSAYVFGKGPSKTTISAPQVGITTATPLTITGSVTDISAGASQAAVGANFPNGLPCVSDASMSQFMEAVYMQQPMPTNITGVPVILSVTDSNGNSYVIGETTTNAQGNYGLTWTPDIPGNFTVKATFAGTDGYYGSSTSTYFHASATAPTASPAPVTAAPPTGMYIAEATVAIIIAIAVATIVIVLVTRKRP